MFSFRIREKLHLFTNVTDFFPFSRTSSDIWQKLSTNRNKQISVHSAGGTLGGLGFLIQQVQERLGTKNKIHRLAHVQVFTLLLRKLRLLQKKS